MISGVWANERRHQESAHFRERVWATPIGVTLPVKEGIGAHASKAGYICNLVKWRK